MPELMPGYRLGRWREPTEAMEDEAGEKARGEDVVMEVVADVEVATTTTCAAKLSDREGSAGNLTPSKITSKVTS